MADVAQLIVWICRSESSRAAHAQPDIRGFSALPWGKSSRTTILTYTGTRTPSFNTEIHCRNTLSSHVWLNSSKSSLGLWEKKKIISTAHPEGSGLHILHHVSFLTVSCLSLSHATYQIISPHSVRISSSSATSPGIQLTAVYSLLSFLFLGQCWSLPIHYLWVLFCLSGAHQFSCNNYKVTVGRFFQTPQHQGRNSH